MNGDSRKERRHWMTISQGRDNRQPDATSFASSLWSLGKTTASLSSNRQTSSKSQNFLQSRSSWTPPLLQTLAVSTPEPEIARTRSVDGTKLPYYEEWQKMRDMKSRRTHPATNTDWLTFRKSWTSTDQDDRRTRHSNQAKETSMNDRLCESLINGRLASISIMQCLESMHSGKGKMPVKSRPQIRSNTIDLQEIVAEGKRAQSIISSSGPTESEKKQSNTEHMRRLNQMAEQPRKEIEQDARTFCRESSERVYQTLSLSMQPRHKAEKERVNIKSISGLQNGGNSSKHIPIENMKPQPVPETSGNRANGEVPYINGIKPAEIADSKPLESKVQMDSVMHDTADELTSMEAVLVVYASGAQYVGSLLANRRHGVGKYNTQDGQYHGEWSEGKFHGRGNHFWSNGDRYCGEFVDGKRHGYGIYYYSNGDKYAGTWVRDDLSGLGMCTQCDGKRIVVMTSSDHSTLIPNPSTDLTSPDDIVKMVTVPADVGLSTSLFSGR